MARLFEQFHKDFSMLASIFGSKIEMQSLFLTSKSSIYSRLLFELWFKFTHYSENLHWARLNHPLDDLIELCPIRLINMWCAVSGVVPPLPLPS